MPAISTTERTEPPAITPVPAEAGLSMTRDAPKCRSTSCGIVAPTNGTRTRCFLASSTPLRIASGTSPALPSPAPTTPLPSPTTTTALKLKRRPPFTTFATRLIWTTFSSRLSLDGSILAIRSSALQVEAALAGALGERANPPVVLVATAIEDDRAHPGRLCTLRDRLADGVRRVRLAGASRRARARGTMPRPVCAR